MKRQKLRKTPIFFELGSRIFEVCNGEIYCLQKNSELEANMQIALNIYFFFEPGKRIFKYAAGFTVCKKR